MYLNVREAGGYSLHTETFHCSDSDKTFPVFVFRATEENELFIDNEDINHTANIIAYSRGPSGYNKDYLLSLYDWHHNHFPEVIDEHLELLVSMTKSILGIQ